MVSPIVRITTAGSVDDGKSTLLAQLLIQSGAVHDDLISDAVKDNYADLLDGLESEREQGITIDVAHRFADLNGQRFHFADSPGHIEYTRNMATACAGSQTLLLVVDVEKGPRDQTFRHLEIAMRLGVQKIIIAVNKMDLVNYDESRFSEVSCTIMEHILRTDLSRPRPLVEAIPVSGIEGTNIVSRGKELDWFKGPSVLDALKIVASPFDSEEHQEPMFQVQIVQRPGVSGRRYLGPLLQGSLEAGDELWHGMDKVVVDDLRVSGETATKAHAGDQISIGINKEMDLGRGDVLSGSQWALTDQFDVTLIWLSSSKCRKNNRYAFKSGAASGNLTISRIFDDEPSENKPQSEIDSLDVNMIARANVLISKYVALRAFSDSHELASFVLIEPTDGQTVAVGTINSVLQPAKNIARQEYKIEAGSLGELTGNRPQVIWFTGLPGSGKSTLADQVSQELYRRRKPHCVLDGDNLRFGLNSDLGFTDSDRTENTRRTAEVAKLMSDSGLIVLVALVSPSAADRELARSIVGTDTFTLVYVNTPMSTCERRDPKGHYRRARLGELPGFTGVSAPYEMPFGAIEISTEATPDILDFISRLGI
jgi:bifunctional enzyme CysN/CysC